MPVCKKQDRGHIPRHMTCASSSGDFCFPAPPPRTPDNQLFHLLGFLPFHDFAQVQVEWRKYRSKLISRQTRRWIHHRCCCTACWILAAVWTSGRTRVLQQAYRPTVITPVPFGTTIDSEIAELTCTIAAQFGEPDATRTLFQRVAVPRRLETSQVDSRNKAIHRGPR